MKQRALCVLISLAVVAPVSAQVVEIGAGIARACIGSDGSFCGNDQGRMWSAYSSLWLNERVEVDVRFAKFPLRNETFSILHDDRFNQVADAAVRQLPVTAIVESRRSRHIVGGEAIYHFARGRPVRAFLGFGLGTFTQRATRACAPAGCEKLLPILVGPDTGSADNWTIIAGASGQVVKRVRVQAGLRLHSFLAEGNSTEEAFVAIGYQFGPH
jgi:hypothetical protein